VEGGTLGERIRERGPLSSSDAVRLLREVSWALGHAHLQGVVHRDVKPGNIMLRPDGSVALIDFGAVKQAVSARVTTGGRVTSTMVATPGYAPPEQTRGLSVDQTADLFGLGATLIHLLTGIYPSDLINPRTGDFEWRDRVQVDEGLARVIKRATAYRPVDRYQSADEMSRDLEAVAERIPVGPRTAIPPEAPTIVRPKMRPTPGPIAEPATDHRRVPRWIWALGGVAVLALVMGVVMAVGGGEGQPTATTITTAAASTVTTAAASSLKIHPIFVSNRDGKREIYHLTEGGEVEQITYTPGDAESWSPVLAADGTILFTSNRDGKREIYHIAKGGEVERVTYTPGNAESCSPVLAADGTILFTSDRDGKREIYHTAKGGEVERVTHTPGNAESWSPILAADGTILFTSDRDGKQEIYHIAKGGEVEQITHTPGDAGSWSPVLAADGTILFTSNRDGKREIYHIAKGGEAERVTRTPSDAESWSPVLAADGSILFTSNRDGKREIYHTAKGGEVKQITYTRGNGESWSPAW